MFKKRLAKKRNAIELIEKTDQEPSDNQTTAQDDTEKATELPVFRKRDFKAAAKRLNTVSTTV